MKTEISRDSHQPEKRYSGVYQQQGRMLTDADWNELVEIFKQRLNDTLKDVVGNGSPLHRNVVNNEANPQKLQWGYVHIDGIQAVVRPDEGATLQPDFEYEHQQDFPEAPGLPIAPDDNFIYYADVWERTVTYLMDDRLRDKGLHGADTCTRKQVMAQIKWCPAGIEPESAAENPRMGDAKATITLLKKSTRPDPCDPCAEQLEVKSRVGNYLFRVEVHDVEGEANNPTKITLKWSSENGAEQYALKDAADNDVEPPDSFRSSKWTYEFFDETSERHLGVHLENLSGWQPVRGVLRSGYNKPEGEPNRFVRRWDGYCKLQKSGSSWLVTDEFDKDQKASISFAAVAGEQLTISLDAREIELELNHAFVAGDYWLAEVREAEHEADDELIKDALPHGVEHRYLKLGKVVGGVLQANPEADRKYAFPPLTEMTRMFIAGGDGQEVMPGQPLPQALRVGVANGEWPVEGATVRFQIEQGGGSLSLVNGGKTSADGIAECVWTPGIAMNEDFRVRATLVDPEHANDAGKDMNPPVYFYANLITADQVAYEPECPDSVQHTVHSHLAADPAVSLDLGTDAYYTVKEVLDALLCKLKAKHIPYEPTNLSRWNDVNAEEGAAPPDTVQQAIDDLVDNLQSEDIKYTPACTGDIMPTVRSKLGIPIDSPSRVHEIFNKLLCDFNATHLPVDRTDLCTNLADASGNEQVDTVQDAINALCRTKQGGGCCAITISPGDDLQARLTNEIAHDADAHICITKGEYNVKQPVLLEGRGHIIIEGCGDGTVIRSPNSESAMIFSQCKSVVVRNLTMQSYTLGNKKNSEYDHLNGALTIRDVNDVVVEAVSLSCAHGGQRMASCLTVAHRLQTSSVRIRACHLYPGHQQVGMLLVNANLARIEDNEVKVRPKSRSSSLKSLLKDKYYRLSIRKMILSDVVVVDKATTADKKRNVEIRYEGRLLRFQTQNSLVKSWLASIDTAGLEKGLHDRDLIRHLKAVADNILLTLATEDNLDAANDINKFKDWFDGMKSHLPAIASQGIVCAGRIANDICITRNSIYGVVQGVHIGLSHNDSEKSEPDHAGRLLLTGNRVVNYLSSQVLGEWHGLFIGNFECLHVENNYLELKKYPYDLKASVAGIRVYGYFGGMMQVRGNRLNGYDPGIFARAVNSVSRNICLWQVENNLLEGASDGPVLEPRIKFIASNNPH